MRLNVPIAEDSTLEWFGELGYPAGHWTHLVLGEEVAERDSFGAVVLVRRLREAIRRLNLVISSHPHTDLRDSFRGWCAEVELESNHRLINQHEQNIHENIDHP